MPHISLGRNAADFSVLTITEASTHPGCCSDLLRDDICGRSSKYTTQPGMSHKYVLLSGPYRRSHSANVLVEDPGNSSRCLSDLAYFDFLKRQGTLSHLAYLRAHFGISAQILIPVSVLEASLVAPKWAPKMVLASEHPISLRICFFRQFCSLQ